MLGEFSLCNRHCAVSDTGIFVITGFYCNTAFRLLTGPVCCFASYLERFDITAIIIFQQVPKDVEKVDLKKPQEMAYVFSGAYTPISCRIVEQVNSRPITTVFDQILSFATGQFLFNN